MEQIKIKILGTEYVIKKTFSALILFEEMSGKTADNIDESIKDLTLLFYCFLKAGNKDTFNFEYDVFIEIIDSDESIFEDFAQYLRSLIPNQDVTMEDGNSEKENLVVETAEDNPVIEKVKLPRKNKAINRQLS